MSMTNFNRRQFLKATGVGAAAFMAGCNPQTLSLNNSKSGKKPNLLFVFPDQMRRNAMGFWGTPGYELPDGGDPVITPNIDAFAKQSAVFTNAVSNCPVCSPFRGMLFTGKYPKQNHVMSNCATGRIGVELQDDEFCFSDVLKSQGYNLGYIGKWHLDCPTPGNIDGLVGWDQYTPPGPARHGFDFWYAYGAMNDHMDPHYWTGDSPKKIQHHNRWSVELETEVAIDFIKKNSDSDDSEPWALFLAYNPPHQPYDKIPDEWTEHYKDMPLDELLVRPNVETTGKGKVSIRKGENGLESVRNYFSAVTGIDHYFGKLLQTLKDQGIDDDTVVVFTSDHGEMMGSQNRMTKGREYTESTGIPFIVHYPKKVNPMVDNLLISVPDIYPTLMGLMDMEDCVPSDVVGNDYSAVFESKNFDRPEYALYQIAYGGKPFDPDSYWSRSERGVISHRYTYVVNRKKEQPVRYLYDNKKDPYQMKKILPGEGYDKVMDQLDVELAKLLKQADDPFKPWNSNK